MSKQLKQFTRAEKHDLVVARLKSEPALSSRKIAASLGVSPTFVSKVKKELQIKPIHNGQSADYIEEWWKHRLFKENPSLLENITERGIRSAKYPGVLDYAYEHGYKSITYAQTVMRRADKTARKNTSVTLTESDIKIFQADLCDGLPQVTTEVDLVLVDPMYDLKSIKEQYTHIANISARVLKNGGSLLVMTGQAHLPEVLTALTSNKTLKYHWTISYIVNRAIPAAPLRFKSVAAMWKPIIWLTKGKYVGDIVPDLIQAPPDRGTDKDHYTYGQSFEVMSELIKQFTDPGQTVLDMCCGGGSSAAASVMNNRRYLGSDKSAEAVKITKRRVQELMYGVDTK